MATLKEKIIAELKKDDGRSDRELADRILGADKPQQSVNMACRELEAQGILRRSAPPIKNFISERHNKLTTPVHQEPKTIAYNPSNPGLNEEQIKQILKNHLEADNWQVKVAWGKEHGADIIATRGYEKWIIEVKGCGSLDAMRVNYFLAIIGELGSVLEFRTVW